MCLRSGVVHQHQYLYRSGHRCQTLLYRMVARPRVGWHTGTAFIGGVGLIIVGVHVVQE